MKHKPRQRLSVVELGLSATEERAVERGTIRKMYRLLGSNTAPLTGMATLEWDTEDQFVRWKDDVFCEGLKGGTRHVLMFEYQELRGFLSYTIPPGRREVYLNEFQIHPRFQGDGVTFRILLAQFLRQIGQIAYTSIRTYANGRNKRAQNLIERMGFTREGRTERGIRYRIMRAGVEARFQRWLRK